ncbi:DUF262 domain-containing protein [Runella sp. CRIBMP]|uniref:GmrSD restriction endonuclease domain-containing protein n=1 Tax=Runella sp. CRIBMP TaxID=2683261 RepID=UPI00141371F1|nr:DUF262 domain-containing protein [Runella sp. CRIBMP]NBB21804.1 DUF262 domain-containing protein [Runella sp. CRIBMP]
MSITPRGMSIQEAYRNYTEGIFLVNRKYQRKLVWTVDEKAFLIDSILNGLPIPLILLAQTKEGKLEIIDGLQRLNAIFSYIENRFAVNELYFDIEQSARAKQQFENDIFEAQTDVTLLLAADKCANILDYQLAVTIYPSAEEEKITDIFGRINSGGKQLSPQEKRQAGVTDNFADLIRKISSEIRGDSSKDILELSEMPQISIDSNRENIGYGLTAEDIFWCSHGIVWKSQLRDSEDEEMIADIVSSILKEEPLPISRELFNSMYDENADENRELNTLLTHYGAERMMHEIKVTFSIVKKIFESQGTTVKNVVNPGSRNPVKGSFYAIFMAVFYLVVKKEKSPDQDKKIVAALVGLQAKMKYTAKTAVTQDRINNINQTIGLIQNYFVKKDPPVLRHGSGLSLDFENSIRRSKVETSRYECKQGYYDLSNQRKLNAQLYIDLINTMCGIANCGPDSDGFIFIGVADKKQDADRVNVLDGIEPNQINTRYVVGIDRELAIEGIDIDTYINRILTSIRGSVLTEPLKSQILSSIDLIDYKGKNVIRIRIPKQKAISFVGNHSYVREGSNTILLEGPKLLAISKLFE